MTAEQNKMLDKIRALFAKTVENGCTEAEALAALAKARAMMDAYEVTEEDLQLSKEEKAILHNCNHHEPHGIRGFIATRVAEFSSCEVWRNRQGGLTFCGLRSDTDMAVWLLDTLSAFVLAELTNHLMTSIDVKGQRRRVINGFVAGCTFRINDRLEELCQQSEQTASTNSRALVLVKDAAVAEAMAAAGIKIGRAGRSKRRIDNGSYQAGKSAGDRASFGRPVGGASQKLLG